MQNPLGLGWAGSLTVSGIAAILTAAHCCWSAKRAPVAGEGEGKRMCMKGNEN